MSWNPTFSLIGPIGATGPMGLSSTAPGPTGPTGTTLTFLGMVWFAYGGPNDGLYNVNDVVIGSDGNTYVCIEPDSAETQDPVTSTEQWRLLVERGPTGPVGPHGNTLYVDQVFGNDTNATNNPYNTSFQTINGAISYINDNSISGHTIFVFPGTYFESVVIPSNTAIRGSSTQTTKISVTGPTGPTTLVTMGSQTRIEDITMALSSTENVGPLTGVLFPNNTSTSSKIRTCVANVTYTGGGAETPLMYGVLVTDDTTPKSYSPSDAMRSVSINVSTNATGPTGPYGIDILGTSYFGVRESNIYCTGPVGPIGPIGVATNNTGCFSSYKQCSVAGTLFDVNQQQYIDNANISTIQLNGTDLINANAGSNGFTVNMEPSHMFFVLGSRLSFSGQGSEIGTTQGTYYLHNGTNCSNFSVNVIGYSFVQKVIVFEGLVTTSQGLTGAQVATVTLYKSSTIPNSLGTLFAGPLEINSTTQSVKFQNKSATFNPLTDFLQIRCVISGEDLTAGNDVTAGIALY